MTIAVAAALLALLAVQKPAQADAASAISKTGLLPVYGVDLALDPADPAALEKAWSELAPLGFGVLRFDVDVRDAAAAERVARMCAWAGAKGVRLVPVLIGAANGEPIDAAFASNAAAFVRALIEQLQAGEPPAIEAYRRILAFQIERAMNDASRHGAMTREIALLRMLQAASAVRQAQQTAFEAGAAPAPVMIEASFDAELKAAGLDPLAPLDDAAYAAASAPLAAFTKEAAASADVDLIAIEYQPGSVGAGSAGDLARLVRDVAAAAPGKTLVVSTGYLAEAGYPDDQRTFYALAFANLADLRASEGPDSALAGVLFRWALDDPAQEALAKVAESVIEADAATPADEQIAGMPPSSAGDETAPEIVTAAKEKVQQFLLGLLDRTLENLGSGVLGGGEDAAAMPEMDPSMPADAAPSAPPAPVLTVAEVTASPPKGLAGKPVKIDALVYNKSDAVEASGLTAVIVDEGGAVLNDDSMPTDLVVLPADNRMVHLTWTPSAPGPYKVGVVITDAAFVELARSAFVAVDVMPSPGANGAGKELAPDVPVGFPAISHITPGLASQVIVALKNPYRAPLKEISVTLDAGGRTVVRTLASMAPGQTRSLTFRGLELARGTQHDVRITMKSGARTTALTSRMRVPAVSVATRPAAPTGKTQPGRISAPQPQPPQREQPPVRTRQPARMQPPARIARPDLAIVDVSYAVQRTRSGRAVMITLVIRNGGTGVAQGAALSCGAGRSRARAQALPAIGPGQMRSVSCQVQLSGTRAAQVGVAVSAPGDANGSNNQRVVVVPATRRGGR